MLLIRPFLVLYITLYFSGRILVLTMCLLYFWQPELVRRVEKDLQNIMSGGTAENIDILSYLLSPLVLNRTTRVIYTRMEVAKQTYLRFK